MLVWQGHWPLLVNAIIWILGRLVAFPFLSMKYVQCVLLILRGALMYYYFYLT
jgi:hypothetical protein